MQWDNNVLEEDYVLLSKRHGEPTDYRSEDVEQLSSSVELVGFVDQVVEGLIDSLSDHLSSWHELGVQLMKNVL